MGIDFHAGCGADGVPVLCHRIVDVAADQVVDGVIIEGVADVSIGNPVLHSPQVDMRKRRLGHGSDDARNPREFIGQGLIDHDVARVGAFFQRHHPQETVSLLPVEGDEIDIAQDVFFQQHIDAGDVIERPLLVKGLSWYWPHRAVRKIVVHQRHAGCQQLMRKRHSCKLGGSIWYEIVLVDAQMTVGSNHIRLVRDYAV